MSGSVVNATLTAAVSGSGADPGWQCVRLLAEEEIGQPYRILLDILTPESGVDPGAVLGTGYDVTYAWTDGIGGGSGTRRWSGTATSLSYLGRVQDTERPVHYRVVLQPALALAQRTRRSRAIVAAPDPGYCTAVDVIGHVLQGLNQAANQDNILGRNYPPFAFFTQLGETDLGFLSRLAETYGISLFWTADTGQGSTLYLTDNNNGFQPLTPAPPGGTVPVNPNAGPVSAVRAVYRAGMRFGQIPASAVASAWQPPTVAGGADGAVVSGTWPLAADEAPTRFGLFAVPDARAEYPHEPIVSPDTAWDPAQASGPGDTRGWRDYMAEIRMAEAAMTRAVLFGRSNLEGLFAGCAIRFDYAATALGLVPQFDVNGFVVQSVSHLVYAPGSHLCFPTRAKFADARTLYANRFRAVPVLVTGATGQAGLTYRPPRRAKRPATGVLHHATLTTTASGQVFPDLDASGRYLVLPDFPLEYVSGSAGTPSGLRIPKAEGFGLASIPGAGDTRQPAGLHMPLRPGQAVLIGYRNGNPDLPFIAGILPDAAQPSPVTNAMAGLPKQSVLRTASGLTVRLTDSL